MSINIPGFTPDLRNAQPSGLPSVDRIADALERIADALERARPKFNPGGYTLTPPWATGDTVTTTVRTMDSTRSPNQCEPGCGRPALHGGDCDAVGASAARVPWDGCESGVGDARGSDRHVADRCGETFNDSSAAEDRVWVCTETVGHVGYHYDAARLVAWGKKLPSTTPDYAAAILSRQTEPDPLDEDNHQPRHDRHGDHWRKGPRGWYLGHLENGIFALAEIARKYGPLTFCDCDDATDTDGATD